MNIHEYQAKELLAKYGIGIPAGHAALTVEEAVEGAKKLPGPLYVVKAQIHAGGRGKGKFTELGPDAKGGVRLSKSIEDVEANAKEMLGNTLVTVQTGDAGKQVNRLYVTDGVDIASEYYLSMLVDRATGRVAMIVSTEGGMDIEEVAHSTPEKITTITIDPAQGFMPHHGRAMAFALKLTGDLNKQAQKLAKQLYTAFMDLDCEMLEINPLVVTTDERLLALDAKVTIEDDALFRHQQEAGLYDPTQDDPLEVEAAKYAISYVKLDGNVGCMVNGAGLAMATMDLIQKEGGQPANFLDVGGGTTAARVAEAFKLILSDKKVKSILVNIFGGIVRCDLIAEGIIQAAKEVGLSLPVVVRLEGTNAQRGRELLKNSEMSIYAADDLTDAARQAVAAAQESQA